MDTCPEICRCLAITPCNYSPISATTSPARLPPQNHPTRRHSLCIELLISTSPPLPRKVPSPSLTPSSPLSLRWHSLSPFMAPSFHVSAPPNPLHPHSPTSVPPVWSPTLVLLPTKPCPNLTACAKSLAYLPHR